MIERGGGARLLLETLENALVLGCLVGKKFQRHRAAEGGVLGAIYHAHAAAAQLIEDAEMRESLCQHGLGPPHAARTTGLVNNVPDSPCGNPSLQSILGRVPPAVNTGQTKSQKS